MEYVKVKVKGDGQECPSHMPLERMYEYRRKLPHYQPAGRRLFVTFRKNTRDPLTPQARDAVLQHCLHDHGKRYQLHAAVVMPEHVHLLLTPLRDEKGWPCGLPAILKALKGTSARSVNKLAASSGPVWQEESFDHVLRSQESFAGKLEYIRQNPVRRGLVKNPEDYPWLWLEPSESDK
jgi:REP element-mobilizing transposase RayT